MKDERLRKLTIPGMYSKMIGNREIVRFVKALGYGKFYISSQEKTDAGWSVPAKIECGKIYLPRELYSKNARYKFGRDDGGLYLIKA